MRREAFSNGRVGMARQAKVRNMGQADPSAAASPDGTSQAGFAGDKAYGTGAERLLESAIELFGRDGFGATSVRAIADHAGVSFALIRISYGSKEGLRDAAEHAVFSEWSQLLSFSGDVHSMADIVAFLREQADNLAKLKTHIRFIRRCILEDRPIANAMLREMLDYAAKENARRFHGFYSNEPFLSNPLRAIFSRLGYILIAPNLEEILGLDILSVEEIEKSNLEELRVQALIEAGLRAEAAVGKGPGR